MHEVEDCLPTDRSLHLLTVNTGSLLVENGAVRGRDGVGPGGDGVIPAEPARRRRGRVRVRAAIERCHLVASGLTL